MMEKHNENHSNFRIASNIISDIAMQKLDIITKNTREILTPADIKINKNDKLILQHSGVDSSGKKINIEANFETRPLNFSAVLRPFCRGRIPKRKKFSGTITIRCEIELTEVDENQN